MQIFVGNFVHATELNSLEILENKILAVENGKIVFFGENEKNSELKLKEKFTFHDSIYAMSKHEFLMPGFIDGHIHAPQFPNNGLGTGTKLLEWLTKFTFPMESNFSDTSFAKNVYNHVVEKLLHNGTTTASYFATIHPEATKILANAVFDNKQRALVGKTNQNMNSPDYYKEMDLNTSLEETEDVIQYIHNLQDKRIQPVVTPRFAGSCSETQMKALSDLAKKYDCHIQSHLSECLNELDLIKKLYPWSNSYAEVYDKMNLLTNKTHMAHGIYLNDKELDLIKDRGVGIVHCPNSNFTLKSGICDVKKLLAHGIPVGLGTDCSGGFSCSLLDSMRMAVQSSNILAMNSRYNFEALTISDAFCLATLGGAKALSMQDQIGNFEVGKEFDALLIDVSTQNSPISIFKTDTFENYVYKFLYTGDDRNISRVYVSGDRVK